METGIRRYFVLAGEYHEMAKLYESEVLEIQKKRKEYLELHNLTHFYGTATKISGLMWDDMGDQLGVIVPVGWKLRKGGYISPDLRTSKGRFQKEELDSLTIPNPIQLVEKLQLRISIEAGNLVIYPSVHNLNQKYYLLIGKSEPLSDKLQRAIKTGGVNELLEWDFLRLHSEALENQSKMAKA